jgi:signal transduction histidine kinase/ligand-binding sensor domain-containing protein
MPARHLARFILLLCLLAAAAAAGRAEQPPIRAYTTADGLASDMIFQVVVDSRGFLWCRTIEGVSRFDGYEFVNYTTLDGLADRNNTDLCETRDGTVWVGTAKGLCRFDPRGAAGAFFVVERFGDDPKANTVNALLETRDGTLWCGTGGGLFRLTARERQWTAAPVEIGTSGAISELAEDRWGGVWVGTTGEVRLVRPDGRVETHPLPGVTGTFPVVAAYADAIGRLWIGTHNGVCRSGPRPSADAPVAISELGGVGTFGWGLGFLQAQDGTLWIAATSGLFREVGADGSKLERRAAIDGACETAVFGLAEDLGRNLWLATPCGALRIDLSSFTVYTKADGLASRYINSILESNAGDLVVETVEKSVRVVHRLEGTTFASVVANLPKENDLVAWGSGNTVIQDREGAWWVPSSTGVFRYPKAGRPEDTLRAQPEPIYAGHTVSQVFEDSRGDVWLSVSMSPALLLRWERATGRLVDMTAGTEPAPPSHYTAICETRDGTVWVGAGRGELLRYTRSGVAKLTTEDGVPTGSLEALYVDDAGRLWVASSRGGLSRVDDPSAARPRFVTFTTAEGLSSDSVLCVVADEWGRVYASTPRGVDRIDLATGRVRRYTAADGVPKGQPLTAFRDRRGALWFGYMSGLARLDPEPPREREPPRTLVTGVRVAGVARPVSALGEAAVPEMELGPNENSLSLEFLGLGACLGEELRYQYKLEGAGGDWSAPSAERTVALANLGPGTYRFLVRAIDAEGVVSPVPADVAFTVAAPLWWRWWFLALAGALVGLTTYGAYRYRVRRLLEIERVRTRIATDLHDDIGANLSRIAVLSEVARHSSDGGGGGRADQLAAIADISRESVASMSDIVWAVNPKKDSLDDMVIRMRRFAGEAFAARGIDLEFRGPEHERGLRLDHETRRELFLIFKECVTNAVRHSECIRAEVDLGVDGRWLSLAVSDDGRGFDLATPSEGNGLESMRRRAASLGGTFDVESSAAGGAGGRGTRVRVTIPLGASALIRRPICVDR